MFDIRFYCKTEIGAFSRIFTENIPIFYIGFWLKKLSPQAL